MTPRIVLLGLDEQGRLQNAEKYGLPRFHPKIIAIRFDGQLYFANVSYFEQSVVGMISKDPDLRYLLVDSRGINGLDASGVEMLRGLVDRLRSNGIELAFCNIKGPVVEVMRNTGLLDKIGKERIFLTEQAALQDFEKRLAGEPDLPASANQA
jgi:SulP family sulfate permease